MHEQFFEAAQKVATRATCNRAHCSAVVVSKDGLGLWNDGPEMINTDEYNFRSYNYFIEPMLK
jgi:hypothetical protein